MRDARPVDVGDRRQTFIDERFIERSHGVLLTVNPPSVGETVIEPETVIEGHRVATGSVVPFQGAYLMYYLAIPRYGREKRSVGHQDMMTCLAVSSDGRSWTRERVGLYEVLGSKENNVVMPGAMGSAFIDPKETYGRRLWWSGTLGEREPALWEEAKGTILGNRFEVGGKAYVEGALYLMSSDDGVVWKRSDQAFLPFHSDTLNQVLYDDADDSYVGYFRCWSGGHRSVCRAESPNLINQWSYRANPNRPSGPNGYYGTVDDELPKVIEPDSFDPPDTDIYTSGVIKYPYADDTYLAFPSVYRNYRHFQSWGHDWRGSAGNDGPLEIQLAVSRDGKHFVRHRTPYIGVGLQGREDAGQVYMCIGSVRKSDEIYQYYAGTSFTHGNYDPAKKEAAGAIYRVTQRLDGFVSVDAPPGGGEFVTPPLHFEGKRLVLNVNCGAMGSVWVQLLDEAGFAIEEYTFAECVPVDRNGTAQTVYWKSGFDVSALGSRPVRLHARMHSAKLYAFQFTRE